MAGTFGALITVLGGMLATLSSAIASIPSSSRSIFALSRDGLVPDRASRVSERFRDLRGAGGPEGGRSDLRGPGGALTLEQCGGDEGKDHSARGIET